MGGAQNQRCKCGFKKKVSFLHKLLLTYQSVSLTRVAPHPSLCNSNCALMFIVFFSRALNWPMQKNTTYGNNFASVGCMFMYCSYCAQYCLGEYHFCCLGSKKPREPDIRQSRVSAFPPVQAARASISPEMICRTCTRPETSNFAFNLLFLPLFGDSFVSLCSVKAQVPVK